MLFLLAAAVWADAATNYVSVHGAHTLPFDTWATAATNVEAAIDAALSHGTVVVSNGIYACNVVLLRAVTLRSAAGPQATILDGGQRGAVITCADPAGEIVIAGFTIQNGLGSAGAGIHFGMFDQQGGVVRDCIVRCNLGIFNALGGGGGGMYVGSGTVIVERCEFTDNENLFAGDAIFVAGSSMLEANGSTFQRHTGADVINNWGGATLQNCLFAHNNSRGTTISSGGLIGCTVVSNRTKRGAVGYGGQQRIINTIVYANTPSNFNWLATPPAHALHTLSAPALAAAGCINTPPRFADWYDDYRPTNGSACINAGSNIVALASVTDVCTARFDFGADAYVTSGAWNNVTDVAPGVMCTAVVDTAGAWHAWTLRVLNAFDGVTTDGVVSAALYPATAQRDAWEANTNGVGTRLVAAFAIEGVAMGNVYTLRFFASATAGIHNTRFACNGGAQSDYLVPVNNVTNVVTLSACGPASNGTLHLDVYATSGGSACLGVLEVIERVPTYAAVLGHQSDLGGTNRIFAAITDIGAYEFTGNLAPRVRLDTTAAMCVDADGIRRGRVGSVIAWTGRVTDPDGTIVDVAWDFGDGTQTNGPALTNIMHAYTSADVFPVTVTATDSGGMRGSAQSGIAIGPPIPCPPVALAGTSDAPETVALAWHDAADDEDGFIIERATVRYETIVDNGDARVSYYYDTRGTKWTHSANMPEYYGSDYAWNTRASGDANALNTATYAPGLPEAGTYAIYVWHPTDITLTTFPRVLQLDLRPDGGLNPTPLFLNARVNGGRWRRLGDYALSPAATLAISEYGSYGIIPADAMRFVRTDGFAPIAHVPANTTAYLDTTVAAQATYLYRVCASNHHGRSAPCDECSVVVVPEPAWRAGVAGWCLWQGVCARRRGGYM